MPEASEHLEYHVHSHLDVFVNGTGNLWIGFAIVLDRNGGYGPGTRGTGLVRPVGRGCPGQRRFLLGDDEDFAPSL